MTNEVWDNFSTFHPNWIYRYRPYSPLSLKELLYQEIFFSYPDELNDPLDLRCSLIIKKENTFVLEYLFNTAFKAMKYYENEEITNELVKEILTSDVEVDELFNEKKVDIIHSVFRNVSDINEDVFIEKLKNVVQNLKPDNLKSVSFSTQYDNPVLWALYANRHKGFCLIFEPSNSKITLRNKSGKEEKFTVYDVNYSKEKSIDLSLLFNKTNKIDTNSVFNKYLPEISRKALLTKNPAWYNEREKRLFGSFGVSFSYLGKQNKRDTVLERLYYYDSKILSGVILGMGLSSDEEKELYDICNKKSTMIRFYKAKVKGDDLEIKLVKIKAGNK